MSLWHRLLSKISKPSPNSRPPEVQKAKLSPASPAAQMQPTTTPVVPLSADQLSAALETWRQQHDFIQAEINAEWDRTQDQLHQRQQVYLRTLHPFLRYYVPLQRGDRAVVQTDEFCVSGEEMRKLSLSYFVALDYFRYLVKQPTPDVIAYLNKRKTEMSHEDWALVERYQPDAALIVKKADAAREHFHRRIPDNFRRETIQKAVDAFWTQYGSPILIRHPDRKSLRDCRSVRCRCWRRADSAGWTMYSSIWAIPDLLRLITLPICGQQQKKRDWMRIRFAEKRMPL